MARATIAIGTAYSGVRQGESRIEIFTDRAEIGFWEGRESSGLSQHRVEQIVRKHVREKLDEATRETRNVTRAIMPKRSGRTAAAVSSRVTTEPNGRMVGTVFVRENRADIARWVDQGTGIYGPRRTPIRPVHAKALRWPVRDARVRGGAAFTTRDVLSAAGQRHVAAQGTRDLYNFAPEVRGQRPQNVFAQAARRSRPLASVDFREAAREAAAEIRLRARR